MQICPDGCQQAQTQPSFQSRTRNLANSHSQFLRGFWFDSVIRMILLNVFCLLFYSIVQMLLPSPFVCIAWATPKPCTEGEALGFFYLQNSLGEQEGFLHQVCIYKARVHRLCPNSGKGKTTSLGDPSLIQCQTWDNICCASERSSVVAALSSFNKDRNSEFLEGRTSQWCFVSSHFRHPTVSGLS